MTYRYVSLVFLTITTLTIFQIAGTTTTAATTSSAPTLQVSDAVGVDLTHLPLGDGKLSSAPKVGWIWPCHINPSAGGAFRNGPWIDTTNGTYDLTAKAVVQGKVNWPQHTLTVKLAGDKRIISTNDLPDHPTGNFPISRTDAAFQYDPNPNTIAAQNVTIDLPASPTLATQPSCTPGAVGILLSGAVLFNALDAPGRDAVAHETQDGCQGHPQESGVYHYHSLTTCLPDTTSADGQSTLVGYAIDGFGIYGMRGKGGKILTSADLDECHGQTSEVEWDGKMVMMYHYNATWDFPYTIGCLRGTYDLANVRALGGAPNAGPAQSGPPQGNPGSGQPDLAAAAAKLGISVQTLRQALGPPPPDLAAAAAKLGISVQMLRDALGLN